MPILHTSLLPSLAAERSWRYGPILVQTARTGCRETRRSQLPVALLRLVAPGVLAKLVAYLDRIGDFGQLAIRIQGVPPVSSADGIQDVVRYCGIALAGHGRASVGRASGSRTGRGDAPVVRVRRSIRHAVFVLDRMIE